MTSKALMVTLLHYFCSFISFQPHSLNTKHSSFLATSRTNLAAPTRRGFALQLPSAWNSLPLALCLVNRSLASSHCPAVTFLRHPLWLHPPYTPSPLPCPASAVVLNPSGMQYHLLTYFSMFIFFPCRQGRTTGARTFICCAHWPTPSSTFIWYVILLHKHLWNEWMSSKGWEKINQEKCRRMFWVEKWCAQVPQQIKGEKRHSHIEQMA